MRELRGRFKIQQSSRDGISFNKILKISVPETDPFGNPALIQTKNYKHY